MTADRREHAIEAAAQAWWAALNPPIAFDPRSPGSIPDFMADTRERLAPVVDAVLAVGCDCADEWAAWLAAVAYGVDWRSEVDPPCSLASLAAAYAAHGHTDTAEEAAWCIEQETGEWGRK